ncbi:MAG: hypothetical protein R3E32_16500 [Chitinophagales bacterium]
MNLKLLNVVILAEDYQKLVDWYIKTFYKRIAEHGGILVFDINFEAKEQFYYGAVNDIEGNQIWVIQTKEQA